MTIQQEQQKTTPLSDRPRRRPLTKQRVLAILRAGAYGGVAAIVGNILVWLVAQMFLDGGIVADDGTTTQTVGADLVVISTIVGTIVGIVSALIIARLFRSPHTVFAWLATIFAVGTINPFFAATTVGAGAFLYAMHLVAGAILIPFLWRALAPHREVSRS